MMLSQEVVKAMTSGVGGAAGEESEDSLRNERGDVGGRRLAKRTTFALEEQLREQPPVNMHPPIRLKC